MCIYIERERDVFCVWREREREMHGSVAISHPWPGVIVVHELPGGGDVALGPLLASVSYHII